jgi:Na+/H+ antiporter NhaD/arsenite permease-like protein
MNYLFSQIVVGLCFIALIVVLFDEKKDYLSYSILLMLIAAVSTASVLEEAKELETYILAIDWEVIFFLISMFTIVVVLNEARVFHEIAKRIVNRYKTNYRKMFYVICIVSTLSASIIEDLSVAIIFIPIIILTCRELKINPAPFLLGMTICINLASTLTPFGSAENIMIANYFDLSFLYFVTNFGPYFIIATAITLFMLDKLILSKSIKNEWVAACEDVDEKNDGADSEEPTLLEDISADPWIFKKNLIGLVVFVFMLLLIPHVHIVGLIGMVMFVFLNPRTDKQGKKRPQITYFMAKVDYKLIYFFMCLFILVHLMEINGTVLLLEELIVNSTPDDIFVVAIVVVIITSVLSGFMDNAPVTIIFLPIIKILIESGGFESLPLIIAFVLGINLGGNFLPQGSAADMMTLELAQKHCVTDLSYKRLTKVGGLFALLHVLIGIGYLAFIIYVFPGV